MDPAVEISVLKSRADRREFHCNLIIHKSVRKTRERRSYGYRHQPCCDGPAKPANKKADIALDEHAVTPTCSICLSEYQVGDVIGYSQSSRCPHHFHVRCILMWLDEHDDCPCCRNNFVALDDDGPSPSDDVDDGFDNRSYQIHQDNHHHHRQQQQQQQPQQYQETHRYEQQQYEQQQYGQQRYGQQQYEYGQPQQRRHEQQQFHYEVENHQSQEHHHRPAGGVSARTEIVRALESLVVSVDQLARATKQNTRRGPCLPPTVDMSQDEFVCQSLQYFDAQNMRAQIVMQRCMYDPSYTGNLEMRKSMVEHFTHAIKGHLERSQQAIERLLDGS